jgi:hypothetical protein
MHKLHLLFKILLKNVFKIYNLDLEEKVAQAVNENPDSHFFMDEVPLGCGITAEELAEVSEKISPENFLWLACQSQLHPSSDDLKECGKLFVLIKRTFYHFSSSE